MIKVMQLNRITIFPVKSLGGTHVDAATVRPWGLENDRRWLVLHPDGTYLTARREARMLTVTAVATGDHLTLSAPGLPSLTVDVPADGDRTATSVSRLSTVRLASAPAHAWLSAVLERPVRLGWLDNPYRRPVSPLHGGRDGDPLNLADAGPLLLATTASMRQLNDWIAAEDPAAPAVTADRFRPNLLVDTDEPFAEDAWRQVRIGAVELRFAEVCDRCQLTLTDPVTLVRGKEPIRTLARHRKWDGRTWFGVRLVPVTVGPVRVGDAVAAF
jgi:uncharacterized protein YcbX